MQNNPFHMVFTVFSNWRAPRNPELGSSISEMHVIKIKFHKLIQNITVKLRPNLKLKRFIKSFILSLVAKDLFRCSSSH